MCLRKSFVDFVLHDYDFSIPIPAHDWLFQLYATEKRSLYGLNDLLTLHRKHSKNTASLGENNTSRFAKRLSILRKHIVHYEWAYNFFYDTKLNHTLSQILYFFKGREKILSSNVFFAFICCVFFSGYAFFHFFPIKWVLGDGFVRLTTKDGVQK